MRLLTFFLCVMSFGFASMGQEKIEGRVIDAETNQGLIGAHIYPLSDWRNGTLSGPEGEFTLVVTDIQDSIVVTYMGFKEAVMPLGFDMMIYLKANELHGGDVTITAKSLVAEEFKYVKFKKLDIYTNPSAKADPILAVNSLPSSTTTDESANISIRGSSPLETGVFMNNVPIYDAVRYSQLNGIGTFSIFNTSIIKDVTVFPGNPPLEFGNVTSGVISVSTDEQILENNATSAIVSLANMGIARDQRINSNQSLKVFSNWQPSGLIKRLNESSLKEIHSFASADLGIYWFGATTNFNWKVINYSVLEGFKFNYRHPTFEGIFNQKKKRSFVVTSLEKSLFGGTLSLNGGLSGSDADFSYSSSAFNVRKTDLFGGLNYLISQRAYSLKVGLSLDQRTAGINGILHQFPYAVDEHHPTYSLDEAVLIRTIEAYSYLKYYLSEKLIFGAGLRKNLQAESQQNYLSRQANLAFIDSHLTITLGGGKYFKYGLLENTGTPFWIENRQGSLDVKYENGASSWTISFFSKRGRVEDQGYSAKGVELFSDFQLSRKLKASTAVTWLDASGDKESYAYDLTYFFRANLSYKPGRMWTVEAAFLLREGSLDRFVESAVFDSELQVFEPNYATLDQRLSEYANLSLSISKVFPFSEKMNVIAFANINNAFDRNNVRSYIYNDSYSDRTPSFFSRRALYIGAMINF